jgi:hypothetical protein
VGGEQLFVVQDVLHKEGQAPLPAPRSQVSEPVGEPSPQTSSGAVLAVTFLAALMVTVQVVAVPVQSPVQLTK